MSKIDNKVTIEDQSNEDEFDITEVKDDVKSSRLVNKNDAKRLLNIIGTKKTLDDMNKTDKDNEAIRKEQFKKALDNINKKIQMASDNPPERLIDIDEFMAEVTKNLSELNITDSTTALDVVSKELKSWGFEEGSDEAKVLLSILEIYHDIIQAPSDDDIINNIAVKLNKKPEDINAILLNIIDNALFENSKYIPMLAKVPRESINSHILIDNILDFCMSTE